jgi:transposase, IS30 family
VTFAAFRAPTRSAIGTLVDRRSRYLLLVHLPDGHSATACRQALQRRLAGLPEHLRQTLTWDQGSEMAQHDRLATLFGEGVFFAYPASPWQRGTNENTNGLVRQYFPKGTDLRRFDGDDLAAVEQRLNHRPRKNLAWCTPHQLFTAALTH